ncbi:hypothetical protein ZYGR_0AI00220 [Zygosaccharomyces rouxii]|uniref:Nuclear division defective protein 1 n=1 Tax=Zygosaccharomyces rouxii TaxID=4956 RepID=A0A1Q3AAW4_ZYGRO|nr:hypothetical protein ZYGR_0AI00220 [Zygosaccharomyces rouxii]
MDRQSPGVPGDDGIASAVASQDADATFFKVISENLKYAFNSPLPTTQFPTPYSNQTQQQQQHQQQQQQQQQQHHSMPGHSNQQNQHQHQQQGLMGQTGANDGNSDSSLVENSMLAGLPMGMSTGPTGEPLNDMNMQPSSVLQFGNTFSNEFLLASPEQFREFLLDSPAGYNFFHRTPAKTPLRFVTDARDDSAGQGNVNGGNSNGSGSGSGSGDLFGAVDAKLNNNDSSSSTNTKTTVSNDNQDSNSGNVKNDSSNDNNANDIGHLDGSGVIPPITTSAPADNDNTQTPLRSIDLNLMFNSNQLTASSPSKKFSVSLTPYGRRVLNDMGTPYAKNALLSSNSALADFQKARKHNVKLQSTPPTSLGSYHHRSLEKNKNGGTGPLGSLYRDRDLLVPTQEENDENDVYGSSPTTIQLNSSVTKSTIKLEPGKVPHLSKIESSNSNNIDEQLFPNDEDRLPVSPTPKCHNNNNNGSLRIPELPKMGSFKSESGLLTSTASNASQHNTHNARPGKVKKNTKKQPKFQIIVANTQKFNVPTMNQRSSKKNGGLKRSQSLLSSSSASSTMNRSQQRNSGGGSASNDTNTNGHSADGVKRSFSFTSRRGQFNGFQ